MTVKHRAGWDECSLNAPEFARALVDAGAAMITVHGRTRAQGFSGAARMEPIAAVRAALPREIPVVGNGDVKDVAAYQRMKRETGCDAVMIGRGAMGNPWLFRTLAALEQGLPDPGPPSLAERHARLAAARGAGRRAQPREDAQARASQDAGLVLARPLRRARRCASARRTVGDPAALVAMGDAFFGELESAARTGSGDAALATTPADPIAKSVARNNRRDGRRVEAEETVRRRRS